MWCNSKKNSTQIQTMIYSANPVWVYVGVIYALLTVGSPSPPRHHVLKPNLATCVPNRGQMSQGGGQAGTNGQLLCACSGEEGYIVPNAPPNWHKRCYQFWCVFHHSYPCKGRLGTYYFTK